MLKQWTGTTATPPRHVLKDIVTRAYETARKPQCCDPRYLARGLGLRPCPTRTELVFLCDGVLHYPEDASLALRGLAIYRLLARRLWRKGNYLPVMTELILPELAAKLIGFGDLAAVQPHAPLALVQSIYMSHGRSGTMRVVRLNSQARD
jgi:hypothetical protein